MAWYRTGTVTVTNGSPTVTGAATAFVANVGIGHGFLAPDGRTYEIAAVVSDTVLTLASNYQGSTASGQAYAIMPTQSYMLDLATQATTLLNTFASVRDGVGAGLHPNGTVSLPAIRFSGDQDTGIYWPGSNSFGISVGGAAGLILSKTASSQVRNDVGVFAIRNSSTAGATSVMTLELRESADVRYGFIGKSSSANTHLEVRPESGSGDLILGARNTQILFVTNAAFRPVTDNAITSGASSFRWSTVYAATGSINTSDEREKTWRGELTDEEYQAGLLVIEELGFFQWNHSIAEHGAEHARYHFGARAQRVWEIFSDVGLVDPIVDGVPGCTPFAFLCFDAWEEQTELVVDENGALATDAHGLPTGETRVVQEAGSRFGIRATDFALFLIAVQARRQSELETRIAALEAA